MSLAHEQSDAITPQEWQSVRELINELQRDEACQVFAKGLFQWDLAVKFFRKTADRRMVFMEPTESDIRFHAMCLNSLLAIGNALVLQSKDFSAEDLAKFQVTHSQVAAYVEELAQSYREFHHGFTGEEVSRIKERIFGAPA